MKKYKFTINGNIYETEIQSIDDDIAVIEVNGTVYNVQIDRQVVKSKTPKLVRSPKPKEDTSVADAMLSHKGGVGKINSPLPGVILEIYVKVGDSVKAGDKLIMLEAMKMENNINAHKDGKVIKINKNKGDSVMEGDLLIEIGE